MEQVAVSEHVLKLNLDEIGLSTWSQKGLINAGYKTVGDIAHMKRADLHKIPAVGAKSAKEIYGKLADLGVVTLPPGHPKTLYKKYGKNPRLNGIVSWEEAEEKYGPLLKVEFASEILGLEKLTLRNAIIDGQLRDYYLLVGFDVSEPKMKNFGGQMWYYFPKKWVERLAETLELKYLKDIAREQNIPYQKFKKFAHMGWLDDAKFSDLLWFADKVRDLLPSVIEKDLEYEEEKKVEKYRDYFSEFNNSLQTLIDDYLLHRLSGFPITFNGEDKVKKGFAKENRPEKVKKMLSHILYKVICYRAEINNYTAKEWYGLRYLNEEEYLKFKEVNESFDIQSFTAEDMNGVKNGIGDTTYWVNAIIYLKPLLYYVLMKKEEELTEEARNVGQYNFNEWNKMMFMKSAFENALNRVPRKKPKPKKKKAKYYADQYSIAQISNALIKYQGNKLTDPLKYVTQLMIGFLAGLRADELKLIQLKDFWFDKKTGFLLSDNNGFGRLHLPEEKSKGGYGPSPVWGTYLVPRLVELINKFLRETYKKYPAAIANPNLYFFRPRQSVWILERPYKTSSYLLTWIKDAKEEGIFDAILSDEEIEELRYHDTRHTVLELIRRTPIDIKELKEWKHRCAQVHARHDSEMSHGDTLTTGYLREIKEEEYAKIIDLTLNFSWNPKAYETVEEEDVEQEEFNEVELSPVIKAKIDSLRIELKDLEMYYSKLKDPAFAKRLKIDRLKEARITKANINQKNKQIKQLLED
ncbi:DNA-directed RNA polymerase subunit alpha C-terminal domain-containing protein [Rossellomorea sp. NS-SX7]|uniref:DNA-directed RNA polymerase subunit alpha C-terminal domain-containing protein n=1 Tax=Rossellomorea sp. NS-SX7 TaxID=3463856 RepID=UPI00405A0CF3